jgi:hypothetical protein
MYTYRFFVEPSLSDDICRHKACLKRSLELRWYALFAHVSQKARRLEVRIGSCVLVVVMVFMTLPVAAGIKILSTETAGGENFTPRARIQEFREQLLAAQAPAVQKRLSVAHMARARGVDTESPTGSRGGTITGSIVVSPEPLDDTYYSGAVLALDEYGYVASGTYWMGDYEDSYELTDVPPGNYYVFFMSEGWDWDAHLGTVVNEFYNDVTDWSAASLVAVTEGGTASGVDFDLASNSGYVEITIHDSQGQPVADTPVEVQLYSCPPDQDDVFDECTSFYYMPTTDASGTATVGPIPLGTFYMSCRAQDFGQLYYPNSPSPADAEMLELTSVGQVIADITFDLPVAGSISGTVTLDIGVPGFGVLVTLFEIGGDSAIVEGTVTDIMGGTYTIGGIPPGDYIVRADPGFIYPDYAVEYYDDKPDAASADIVTVIADQTTHGIDFILEQGGGISGTIATDCPEGYENTFFYMQVYDPDDSTAVVKFSFVEALGDYTVGGLPPGDYKISIQGLPYPLFPFYYDGVWTFDEATTVTVTGTSETTGIDFFLPGLGRISGQVTTADGSGPIQDIVDFVIAYPESIPLFGDPSLWFLWPAPVEEDGSYFIAGLPTGSYRVWASTVWPEYNEPGFTSEYYGGAFNFYDAALVPVFEGLTTEDIDIEVDPEAVVQGYVELPDGSAASDEETEVLVVAYNAESGYPVGIGFSDEAPVFTEDNNTFCAGYRIRQLPGVPVKVAAVPLGAQAAIGYGGGGHTFDVGTTIQLTSGQTYPDDVDIALSQGTATISGTVTREDTGEPLNWVAVSSYDPTGHVTGWALSGTNPSTNEAWQDGRYEIRSFVSGSTHYLRTWSFLAWWVYTDLNPGVEIIPSDEWYNDVIAEMPVMEFIGWMPFGYYYYLGVMPFVANIPGAATAVTAPASNINFALGFQGQDVKDQPAVVPEEIVLTRIWPNPSTGDVGIEFSLRSPQQIRVHVLDVAGRMLGSAALGETGAGTNRVVIDLRDINAALASGVYTLRLNASGAHSSETVVILK